MYIQLMHHSTVQNLLWLSPTAGEVWPFPKAEHIRFSTNEAGEINPAAVLPAMFHSSTRTMYMAPCSLELFCALPGKRTKKSNQCGEESVLDDGSLCSELPLF